MTADEFHKFIEDDVLPKCNPWPGPRSVIIMDNAKIHRGGMRTIEDAGCKCEYLPPYSPDYNPIEFSFSVIKKELKGHYRIKGDESLNELAEIALQIAAEVVTPELARNQFRHCNIRVD